MDGIPGFNGWVRGTLVGIAAGLVLLFAIAAWLKPYAPDGRPLRMATHRQIGLTAGFGLPPCTFYSLTRLPCPSCGMTTSFALLMHGDVGDSLRANAVGTLLAGFCLLLIPWCLASAYWRRPFFIRSMEKALTWTAVVFLGLMLLRWIIVVAIVWN